MSLLPVLSVTNFPGIFVGFVMDVNGKTREHDQYEIQFFGFNPDSFVNGGKSKDSS